MAADVPVNCPACGFSGNRADSRFCGECGATLAREVECKSCGRSNDAGRRFCDGCGSPLVEPRVARDARAPAAYTPKHLAEKILTSRSAIEGERKQVTVLFADVKGSMEMSESVDPEEWHRIMERFFKILTDGVHRFEGTINQYTGDGIMALFGAPIAHEDHAQRACYAALSLQEELRGYANELRLGKGISFSVRMGLNSGEVVVGKIGDDLRMDYTALGHTASLAARMEQIAAPDCAYLTEHTAKLVEGLVTLQDLGPMTMKGVREPLRVSELSGIGRLRTKLEVSRARGFSKFVGREREMALLEDAFERALRGNGQVVGIVADPGVGKSRLCYEFVERCRSRGITAYQTHGVSHGKSVPFLPILDLFRSFFGITEQDSDQAAREKIAGRLLLLDENPEEGIPLIFEFLGVPDPERPAPRMGSDPQARQRQLLAVVKRVMHARSRREPIVNLLEDLHWFDGGSESFLETMVEATAGTRTLLLTNFRPEYHARWMQRSYYQQLPLAPLTPEATAELLRDLLGSDPSVATLAPIVRERTGGTPFFIEEVVQSLVETRSLEGTRGAYRLTSPIARLAIPATVQAVLASRIDRLPQRDKQVLQTAAVIGKTFPESVLKRVADATEADLAASLSALEQGEFLYEEALYPEAEYAFKHPLTQEVAYGSQLSERRGAVHAKVARTIEELHPDKLDEHAALVAHHWEAAGERLEAARWNARAAQWAGANAPAESVRHWRKVRTFLEAVPVSDEVVALGIAARASPLLLGWRIGISDEEAHQMFSEGRALAEQSGDRRSLAMLLLGYGVVRAAAGSIQDYPVFATEAVLIADALGDPALKLTASSHPPYASFQTGRLRECARFTEEALSEPPRDVRLGSDIVGFCPYLMNMHWKAAMALYLGRLVEARSVYDQAERLAREHGDIEVSCATLIFRSEVRFMEADSQAALNDATRAVEVAEKVGSAFFLSWARAALGRACLAVEAWDDAAEQSRLAVSIAREHGTAMERMPFALSGLAEALLGRGDLSGARAAAEEAVQAAARRGVGFFEIVPQLALVRVLLRADGATARPAIEAALARALAGVEESGARTYEPFILVERAELAGLIGDEAGREHELREARRLFLEIGAPLRAEQVARELKS